MKFNVGSLSGTMCPVSSIAGVTNVLQTVHTVAMVGSTVPGMSPIDPLGNNAKHVSHTYLIAASVRERC